MYLGTVRVYFTSLFNHNNFFDVTTAFFFSLHLLRDRHETPQKLVCEFMSVLIISKSDDVPINEKNKCAMPWKHFPHCKSMENVSVFKGKKLEMEYSELAKI